MAVQQHADIIAVSYEARALGVRKHMPTATIRREHPSVKLVHVEVLSDMSILQLARTRTRRYSEQSPCANEYNVWDDCWRSNLPP